MYKFPHNIYTSVVKNGGKNHTYEYERDEKKKNSKLWQNENGFRYLNEIGKYSNRDSCWRIDVVWDLISKT